MGEFYAQGGFLDKNGLYAKYSSICTAIDTECTNIENAVNILKRYSGFGIETQYANLEGYRNKLKEWRDDVNTEWRSLEKIIDTVNEKESKAVGIFGGIFDEEIISEYTYSNEEFVVYSDNGGKSYSNVFEEFINTFKDLTGDTSKLIDGIKKLFDEDFWNKFDWIDKFRGVPKTLINEVADSMGMASDSVDGILSVFDTIQLYSDGKVSFLDIVKTADNSKSFLESVLKITESIADVHFMVSKNVNVTDTVKIAGVHAGKFTQYLPVVGVFLTSLISGVSTYERVSADGEVSVNDGCEIAFDGAMDGLIACAEALLVIACPPAAIGVAIFELADFIVDLTTGSSIKDMAKDGLKKGAAALGEWLNELVGCTA